MKLHFEFLLENLPESAAYTPKLEDEKTPSMTATDILHSDGTDFEISLHRERNPIADDMEFLYAAAERTLPDGSSERLFEVQAGVFLTDNFLGQIMDYLNPLALAAKDETDVFRLSAHAIGPICLTFTEENPLFRPRAFIDLTICLNKVEKSDVMLEAILSKLQSEFVDLEPIVALCSTEDPSWSKLDLSRFGFSETNFGITPNLYVARWEKKTPNLRVVE